MNKKGVVYLFVIALILGIIIMVMVSANFALRECNNNSDCPEDSYCSSNHQCHQYPNEVLVTKNNFLPAAIVLGASLIVAAYIFRRGGPREISLKDD